MGNSDSVGYIGRDQVYFNFIMIIGFEKSDISNWKEELHNYEQRKMGKLPFEKESQKQFVPLEALRRKPKIVDATLQKYASAQIKTNKQLEDKAQIDRSLNKYKNHRYKYEKDYDIISLHPLGESMIESESQKRKKNNAPIRNLYNIINGQKLSGEYLKERHIVLPIQHAKKDVTHSRQFNILNLQYKTNNEAKQQIEAAQRDEQAMKKYNNSHVYDKIYGRYYSSQQEEKYWSSKKAEDIKEANIARQNYENKLPKSYQVREPFIQDYTKPLPKGLQQLDKIHENNKRSHLAKYIFQAKHQIKNIEEAEKAEERSKNKYKRVNGMRLNKSSFIASKINERRQNLESGKIKSYGFS